MSETKKRYDGLDIIKAIAIMAVLSLHVPLWHIDFLESPGISHVLQYAIRLFCEGVPIFVLVNGFLLMKRSKLDLKKHYVRILRMFLIFLLWCVILVFAGAKINHDPQPVTLAVILDSILATDIGSSYTGMFWFLQNLLSVYLLYPAIWTLYNKDFKVYMLTFFVIAFFAVGVNFFELIRDFVAMFRDPHWLNGWLHFLHRYDSISNTWYVYYFMLGGVIWHYLDRILAKRKEILLAALASMIFVVAYAVVLSYGNGWLYREGYNYNTIFNTIILTGMFALFIPYRSHGTLVEKGLLQIGKRTMGMYLSHYIFIYLLDFFVPETVRFWPSVLRWLFVLASSCLFSILLSSSKHTSWMIEI